jgi:hypothetical protein
VTNLLASRHLETLKNLLCNRHPETGVLAQLLQEVFRGGDLTGHLGPLLWVQLSDVELLDVQETLARGVENLPERISAVFIYNCTVGPLRLDSVTGVV